MANASADTWSRTAPLSGQDVVTTQAAPVVDNAPTAAPVAAAPVAATPVATAPTAAATTKTVVRSSASVTRHRIVRKTFAQRLLTEARRHYGARYQWGATGPYRFDCSGFTGYVFRKLGVRLPRTSRDQYRATRHVSRSAKRAGDLIFGYSSSGRIHHVGIYAGRGRMIAATHTGDIVRFQDVRGRYKVGRVR